MIISIVFDAETLTHTPFWLLSEINSHVAVIRAQFKLIRFIVLTQKFTLIRSDHTHSFGLLNQ